MSATNNIEALKAQAVAAYTYSIYKMEKVLENPEIIPEHKGAYVCTDYNHCKAYLSKDGAKQKWGEKWFEKYQEEKKRLSWGGHSQKFIIFPCVIYT